MEVELGGTQKVGFSSRWPSLSSALDKLRARMTGLFKKIKKIGEDDPRRVVHSLKVGLALTLVSVLYYVTPLFNSFGASAIWAVFTVVVVMEYTVGATLSKGLNRAFATLVAGALGVGIHEIADISGERGEPIVLGIFVFVLAAAATFSRFIPEIKARYDYGVTIFILTFSLVAVSSYRIDDLIELAHQRLSTIAIGVAICLFTTLLVFPVWAGEDFHKLTAANLEKLASFLEGLGGAYFVENISENWEKNSFLQRHKSVLNTKAMEESMANFARWEPGHGRFGFRHPWKHYLTIGASGRHCAYCMEALSTYITKSKCQIKTNWDLHRKIQAACMEMSIESSKALMELGSSIRTMTVPFAADIHITAATANSTKLMEILSNDDIMLDMLHDVTVASLLTEIVRCIEQIIISVEELARSARFKRLETLHAATVKPVDDPEGLHIAISIEKH